MSSPDQNGCADFEAQLLPDRNGQVDLESSALRDHLPACRSCREVLEARAELARDLARAPRLVPTRTVETFGTEPGPLASFRSTLAAVEGREERLEGRWAPALRAQPRIPAPEGLWSRILASLGLRSTELSPGAANAPVLEGNALRIVRLRPVASVAAALVVVGSVVAVVQLARPDHDRPGGYTGTFGEALVSDGVQVHVEQVRGPDGLTLTVVGGWRPTAVEGGP